MPTMMTALIAKWMADINEVRGIYDIGLILSGYPFLNLDYSMRAVRKQQESAKDLIPSEHTMMGIVLEVPDDNLISRKMLERKINKSKQKGFLDEGFVIIRNGLLQGYITEMDLDFGLNTLSKQRNPPAQVQLLSNQEEGDNDLSMFVDRSPLTIFATAPLEHVLELFGKLGLSYLCILEERNGKLIGVSIKSIVLLLDLR